MKFCEKLKQLRIGKGLTQEELAKMLFVSRSAVAKWEQGRGYPSLEMLERLSEIFEFSIDDLLSEKEYRIMTIETNNKSKKQKNYNKIIGIISGIIIVSLGILFLLYFKLEKKPETTVYEDVVYAIVEVEENSWEFSVPDGNKKFPIGDGKSFLLSKEEANDVVIYDKYGKNTDMTLLRSGLTLKISYTNEIPARENGMKINRIDIIEDYVEGDYYIYGCFFSTEPVDYYQPPIYSYKNQYKEEVYNWRGEVEDLGARYPYFMEYRNGYSYSTAGGLERIGEETLIEVPNPVIPHLFVPIKEERTYSISISERAEKLYIYVLDNTEKGYSFAKEVDLYNFDDKSIDKFYDEVTIDGALLENTQSGTFDIRYPKKIDAIFNIQIITYREIASIAIEEYDSSFQNINTENVARGNSISIMYMTQDITRYSVIYMYDAIGKKTPVLGYGTKIFRGENVEIPLENYYGFISKCSILFC